MTDSCVKTQGQLLYEFRSRHAMSMAQLAEHLGCSRSHIDRVERGAGKVSKTLRAAILAKFPPGVNSIALEMVKAPVGDLYGTPYTELVENLKKKVVEDITKIIYPSTATGLVIGKLLLKHRISQLLLAARLGLRPAYICGILHERQPLTDQFIDRLQKQFPSDEEILKEVIALARGVIHLESSPPTPIAPKRTNRQTSDQQAHDQQMLELTSITDTFTPAQMSDLIWQAKFIASRRPS